MIRMCNYDNEWHAAQIYVYMDASEHFSEEVLLFNRPSEGAIWKSTFTKS